MSWQAYKPESEGRKKQSGSGSLIQGLMGMASMMGAQKAGPMASGSSLTAESLTKGGVENIKKKKKPSFLQKLLHGEDGLSWEEKEAMAANANRLPGSRIGTLMGSNYGQPIQQPGFSRFMI
jgi:hypothetical protein